MTKIKVNINKPDPPPQVIQKYKNYNSFVDTYQRLHTPNGIREMFYRDKVKMSMIIVFLMLLLIFVLTDIDKKEEEPPAPAEDGAMINNHCIHSKLVTYNQQTIKKLWV